jgi:hypothetical protein
MIFPLCEKEFSITVAGTGEFFNLEAHTAYAWCDNDPVPLYAATIGIGISSSFVSQQDAEDVACAAARAALTASMPGHCANFTLAAGCNSSPPLYSNVAVAGLVYYCDGDCGNIGKFLTGTCVAADSYYSRISQVDADAQAQAFHQYLVDFVANDGAAECFPNGPPSSCGAC